MKLNQKIAVVLVSTALGMAGATLFPLEAKNQLSAFQQVAITKSKERIKFNANISEKLLSGERWLEHLKQDLLPFWTMKSAFGKPLGNFPTFRCNDGSLFNPINSCRELIDAESWISEELNKEFVVSKSRQTYAYGVAYHLTGDEKMLSLAKAGVDYLRRKAYEKSTGSAITSWKNGISDTPVLQRTTQELAYAQLGLSFYYYLTRDEEVLTDIIRLKNYIFTNYYNPSWDMLMWVKQEPEWSSSNIKESERKNLVAQLDQLNAYMLLLTPLLPEPERTQWKKDMIHIIRILLQQYYSPQHNLFWGSLDEQEKKLGKLHTDFGHTIKVFWMMYLVGNLTNNNYLKTFAKLQAAKVLEQAYIEKTGAWASWLTSESNLNEDKHWWIYTELDQMAATLSLKDSSFSTKYLTKTYDYWFKYIVDPEHHEVWAIVDASGKPIKSVPKVHQWKNGYHSLEHALVGYITSQAFHRKPATLYYAYKKQPPSETIHPYFYTGRIQNKEISNLKSFRNHKRIKVTFTDIQ